MTLDFWFLLIIVLILCASILTAYMLSEHFSKEQKRMEQQAIDTINSYDISERVEIPKSKVADQEFYWNGGKATLKCKATTEGVVC